MTKLEPGMEAPDFELQDHEGRTWTLSDLRGRKVILYFYPADFTSGCTLESCDFRDSKAAWEQAGYTVLGVSPQPPESKRAFAEANSLNFPLLADVDRKAEEAYGTAAESSYEIGEWLITTSRSTFVIDEQGKIQHALYGVGSKEHVASLRELLGVS